MKLTVDSEKCQGHGRCYAIAPELFDIDEIGNASARVENVTEHQRAAAELAAANCPEKAIRLGEEPTGR